MFRVVRSTPNTKMSCHTLRWRWLAELVALFHNIVEVDECVGFWVETL